ncbi:hypothetical protein GRB70_21830 [Bradyrhizobium neotropicale]|nr:hypothetical protein [Bradyrhizobium neotropicale]
MDARGPGAEVGFGGFYKVRFQLDDAVGRSVMHAHDGKMLGGNSAFAHIGTYEESGDDVSVVVRTVRHNPDPNYPAMAGTDDATLVAQGRPNGDTYRFEGGLREVPGVPFQALLTPIEEQEVPIAGSVGEGGIANGLYSIHLRLLDGVSGGLTGVMLLKDGRIVGGDAFFYYLGTYVSENGRWKGQILNQEHTPARGENPIFGGHEVGIGFSGTCNEEGAVLEATALAGKRSLRLTAVLKLMRRL